MPTTQDLRVGIVGLGPHFRETVLPVLIGQKGIILSAFCDRVPDKLRWVSTRFPQTVITDVVSSPDFWTRIDCVVCCSWPLVHEQVLSLAIQYNRHCFCEKPAAASATALERIIAEQTGSVIIRIGHTFRYMGGAARFIELATENDITCLEVTYLGSGPNGSRWDMIPRKSFSLTHLTHAVDFVTAVAGRITKVVHALWSASGDTDTVIASFVTERCPVVSLFATNAASAFTCKASGVLSNGALLHLDNLRNVTLTGKNPQSKRSGEIWKERDLGTRPQNDGYMDELQDFFDEIRGSGQCRLPGLAHAKHVLEVIEKIEERG